MAAISPGKSAGPPRRPHKQTQTTKAHRYEPFTKRVARLKIDPIHKVQRSRLRDDENTDDISQSYFRSALEEWSELNLTTTFTSFFNKVNGLCESLPQILHHADQIVALLLEHIERRDPLALEALLSLVAHLAHDLGQGFEKYFVQTVSSVAHISTSQEDPAVVEACFTCLTWIYKYLSRLLVQDLTPLLHILLPYFSARKDYIRRFTAESLAFLLRKAAILYPRNQKPLTTAVRYIFAFPQENRTSQGDDIYVESCMTLLSDSAAGVDAGLHSSAVDLYRCMHELTVPSNDELSSASHILEGVTTNLVHRCDATGFRSLFDHVVDVNRSSSTSGVGAALDLRLLLVTVATRGGTRVQDWQALLQVVHSKIVAAQSLPLNEAGNMTLLLTKLVLAIVIYAPLEELLPWLTNLITEFVKAVQPFQFFSFCEIVGRLNKNRFQDLVLSHLQHFIATNWAADQSGLILALHSLQNAQRIQPVPGKQSRSLIPISWETSIQAQWGKQQTGDDEVIQSLLLARSSQFPRSQEVTVQYRELLLDGLRTALTQKKSHLSSRIYLGWGLQTVLSLFENHHDIDQHFVESFATIDTEYFQVLPFVQAFSQIAPRFIQVHSDRCLLDTWTSSLIDNMLNTSVQLRDASLVLLFTINSAKDESWLSQAGELLKELLETEYTIANARQISMLLRRLPQLHRSAPAGSFWVKLVPYFTLGLLPNFHDRLRKDAAIALSQMMTGGTDDESILGVLKYWLQVPQALCVLKSASAEDEPSPVSPFECTRMNAIDVEVGRTGKFFENAKAEMHKYAESVHGLMTTRIPEHSRSIALQALAEMPQLAEKKSKILVPAFLAAQRGRATYDPEIYDESQSVNTLSPDIEDRDWTLKERKLLLQLMAQFNNPRVLYRSQDIRVILEDLLTNGDSEVRKLSLTALLKWKDRPLLSHQEILFKVAEEKQTTSELSLLLSTDIDTRTIKVDDRSEVLPILLRLVFGQLIGRGGSHGTQEAKRKAILRVVFRMTPAEVLAFLDIVLGRLQKVSMDADPRETKALLKQDLLNADQQYGFLRMINSMLEILQTQFTAYGSKVFDAVLYCTLRANHQIASLPDVEKAPALIRNTRRTGIQCLNFLFEHCQRLESPTHVDLIHAELIIPRLQNFTAENSQGVSALLRMLSIWSRTPARLQYLRKQNSSVLSACWGLLASESAKPAVKIFILEDIIGKMLDLVDTADNGDALGCVKQEASSILDSITSVLQQLPSKDLLLAAAHAVQRLVSHVASPETKSRILQLLTKILQEPSQRLAPHIKGQLLRAVESIAQDLSIGEQYAGPFFELLSSFLDYFRDKPNRDICLRLLELISRDEPSLTETVTICKGLNARSQIHLEDPDHDQQSAAFTRLHDLISTKVSPRSLLPVLYNLIFLMRTSDDTAVRGNALGCLKHFVSLVDDGEHLIRDVLLHAIKKHIKDDSELVRADFVEVLGAAVKHWETDPNLQDMKVLLVGNDEEASFFNNILHIQQHRRTRAIRRLVTEVESGVISASNVADYFLPLLRKFTDDESTSDSAQATKGQSIASMTTLLQWLEWKTFRRVFRQYRQSLDGNSEDEKIDARLLNHAADALRLATSRRAEVGELVPHLVRSLPTQEIISQELRTHFIPKLADLSHYKDEAEVSQRIPASVVAIKLIDLLPEDEKSILATPIVLDVAQVLRSRTQETRDLARNKLAEIVTLLGPSSIQFVLKELRTALTRGYQLHVLSYTLHTILLATADQRSIGDLDYCLDDMVKVILDDVFGAVGHEKESQDYISSMKEVKSNKSFDSMEILSRCTSIKRLAKLVLPFESLLSGSLNSKQIRQTDELFRRVGVGISHSSAASNQDLLVFAFELIQSFYKAKPAPVARPKTNDEKNRDRYLIQKDNVKRVGVVRSSSLLYKIAKFAIDMARSTFARHPSLMTPENVHGFLPIVGDALVEAQEDVKISAMRLLSTVIKLNLPELERDAQLYVIEAVKVVKGAISTNEEAAQAALKTVAAILRDKRDVEVRESDVAYLLKRTMPDLEEPDRQGVTFNFVKAVMVRQMQMPEIYELVDKLGLMMVTSQSRNSRDAARGVYVHFLLDYPQGKTRWSKQVKFLIKNLEYDYPEGRQSIMEAMSTLLAKTDKGTTKELAAVLFVPIVLRMANDEHEKCRELAAALLSQLIQKSPPDQTAKLVEPLHAWLEQHVNTTLQKISLQVWTIFFKSANGKSELDFVNGQLPQVLQSSEWEVQYHALELMIVLTQQYPEYMLSKIQQSLWGHVVATLTRPHAWLHQSASSLISLFFHSCESISLPVTCSYGLRLHEETITDLLKKSLKILKRQSTNEQLAELATQNLLFLVRCADGNGLQISLATKEEQSDSENEETGGSISALQYIIDQATRNIRREPAKQTSAATLPRIYMMDFVILLLRQIKIAEFKSSVVALLIPLLHITSTNTFMPRSSDSTFSTTYQNLIEHAQLCIEALQSALGDKTYMACVTAATRQAREVRQGRRNKRAIETITEPEKAAQEKRRKFERKKDRKKEVKGFHRSNRRKDLGF